MWNRAEKIHKHTRENGGCKNPEQERQFSQYGISVPILMRNLSELS